MTIFPDSSAPFDDVSAAARLFGISGEDPNQAVTAEPHSDCAPDWRLLVTWAEGFSLRSVFCQG
ncbi:MAG: hypothetical protein ACPGNT_00745 [Rhodospirillales bacterium]